MEHSLREEHGLGATGDESVVSSTEANNKYTDTDSDDSSKDNFADHYDYDPDKDPSWTLTGEILLNDDLDMSGDVQLGYKGPVNDTDTDEENDTDTDGVNDTDTDTEEEDPDWSPNDAPAKDTTDSDTDWDGNTDVEEEEEKKKKRAYTKEWKKDWELNDPEYLKQMAANSCVS